MDQLAPKPESGQSNLSDGDPIHLVAERLPVPIRRSLPIAALCAALLLASCGPSKPVLPALGPDDSPIVATVAGTAITFADLQVIAAQNGYNLQRESDRELALRDAVNQEILAVKAKELGYQDDPEIRRYVKAQSVQKLLLATVDKEHQGDVPTEEDLKTYYEKNRSEFTPPTLAKAQVLGLAKRVGQEEAFTRKLEAVQAAIEAKEATFGDLVTEYSDDPAAQTYGGITNWIVQGEDNRLYPKPVIDAIFAAPDTKAIAGPITQNDWVYYVRLHERRDGAATDYEQAKPRIAQLLKRQQRLDAYNALVDQLKTKATVQTFPDKVTEELERTTKQSGPPMGPVRVAK